MLTTDLHELRSAISSVTGLIKRARGISDAPLPERGYYDALATAGISDFDQIVDVIRAAYDGRSPSVFVQALEAARNRSFEMEDRFSAFSTVVSGLETDYPTRCSTDRCTYENLMAFLAHVKAQKKDT